MQNYTLVVEGLKNAYRDVKAGKGSGVGIIGDSGIGKTYVAKKFLSGIQEESFPIYIKGLPIAQSAYSSIYEGIFNSIPKSKIGKEILVRLLKKYSRLLPGFGKYISPLIDINAREAMADVITKSNLPVGISPAPHIIRFLNELVGKKHAILICDDAQWIDPETWSCLVFIAESLSASEWLMILIFNDRIETWTSSNKDRLSVIDRWKIRSNEFGWTMFQAEPWTIELLPILCERLLKERCRLPEKSINKLFNLSAGIPLFLKSILDYLCDNEFLILKNNAYEPTGNWENLDIGREIHDSIIHQLERIYKEIPDSRQSLEVASVLGDPFSDEVLDDLLELCNNFQLLSQIEDKSPLIQYIFQHRHWIFQHNQVKNVIYKSLGPAISKRLHKKVGDYLETNFSNQHLTIAYHFEIAGDIEKETQHLHSEIEKLLGQSLFDSALMLSESTIEKVSQYILKLNERTLFRSSFLHGQCLYHLGRYREAINEFNRALNEADSNHSLASLHRWLGRCYMKLDSQEDFKNSLNHLKIAQALFEELESIRDVAQTNSDLVVTYAHLNCFNDSEAAFFKAEKGFNQSKDRIGMAKLQRRNVIFMESEVSAPILEKIATTFQNFGIPHERIMALNNGATEYLYIDQFDKSRQLLETALEESTDIGNYGQVYLYNNLCLAYFMQKDFKKAKECIRLARSCRQREIEQLIIDINESAMIASAEDIRIALPMLERATRIAKKTGEKAYLFPSVVNLSLGYFIAGDTKKSLDTINSVQPEHLNSYSIYKNYHWFRLMEKCYKLIGSRETLKMLHDKFSWCNTQKNSQYYETDFSFIDMQFWGD